MERLTGRQKRFCQRFVEWGNATAAARDAGYAPNSARVTAHRLLGLPKVAERIRVLQAEMAETHCRNRDALLAKLEAVFRQSVNDNQFTAAARAVELQARLGGLTSGRPSAAAKTKAAAPADPPSSPSASASEESES